MKILNLIKKVLLILSLTLVASCYNVDGIEDVETETDDITIVTDTEQDTETDTTDAQWECENKPIPDDKCVGSSLYMYTGGVIAINNVCSFSVESIQCYWDKCIDDGNGDARCWSPCDGVKCVNDKVGAFCESDGIHDNVILAIYKLSSQSLCKETEEEPYTECITIPSTRRYCGCVEGTNDRPAHCWGDYEDEVKEH